MYSWSLTQRDCNRINVSSGNRTSAPVQALDHKSNSIPLGCHAWPMFLNFIEIWVTFKIVTLFTILSFEPIAEGPSLDAFEIFRQIALKSHQWSQELIASSTDQRYKPLCYEISCNMIYYTFMKSWKGYIFTAVCVCVCLCVCVVVCKCVCVCVSVYLCVSVSLLAQ